MGLTREAQRRGQGREQGRELGDRQGRGQGRGGYSYTILTLLCDCSNTIYTLNIILTLL
jgi:hypothetical protein